MKILIAVDMEGISGVVNWEQVTPGSADYERFRRLMTEEVNAAIRGAYDGGASEVLVTDGHNFGRNILIEALDPRARLHNGSPAPLTMIEGIDEGTAGVFFIGYHAQIGEANAVLEHTWSDERVTCLWVNGVPFGEAAFNAAVCGQMGVPVVMVSGDEAVCAEAQRMLGFVETAAVKRGVGRMAADCLAPPAAQALVYAAAQRAARRLGRGEAPPPFVVASPIHLEVDFVQSEMADKAMLLPGASRMPGRRIAFDAGDMIAIHRAFRALLALARNN
jgi:D-amino peptidase